MPEGVIMSRSSAHWPGRTWLIIRYEAQECCGVLCVDILYRASDGGARCRGECRKMGILGNCFGWENSCARWKLEFHGFSTFVDRFFWQL